MKKFINKVTVTGADDSVAISDMIEIQKQYPFVEFAILLSSRYSLGEGTSRFPSKKWLEYLVNFNESSSTKLNLAGHICGKWVKETLLGNFPDFNNLFNKTTPFKKFFSRWQLNTHAEFHDVNFLYLSDILTKFAITGQSIIFQIDGVNELITHPAIKPHKNISGLFDLSHGAGILPAYWPHAENNVYVGYAGGLSPDNVVSQLDKIESVVDNNVVWIDAETHLRTPDNRSFDLNKVKQFLENASPYVI